MTQPAPILASCEVEGLAAKAQAARGSPYLAGMNPAQRAAVEALEGPVLVLAGAGTGKTRVLTTRIAHILATGRARPHEILAVTFTNKAAREMKNRIGALIGPVAEGIGWLGTFHYIGTRLLRAHAERIDLRPDFTILDADDQLRLMKQVLQAENIDEKRWPARLLAARIEGWKNRALAPQELPAGEGLRFAEGQGQRLYARYQERLKTLNAVDFGDLLLEPIRLLRQNPDLVERYRERFVYILVDEYQDTNVAQYLWLRLLAAGRRNLCCVGDDDQSIYGWRGAEVDNILRFEQDFPGAKLIRLERNYRSTGHILGAASGVIAQNAGRLGKTLFTEGAAGEKVGLSFAFDGEEEARNTARVIEELQASGHALDEVAVLVRAAFQMREFEERFLANAIPYRVIGGPRFYERAEIRDALAYLRAVIQPAHDLAFERILNLPRRGLGDAVLALLHREARAEGVPLRLAAHRVIAGDALKPRQRQALAAFLNDLDRWASQLADTPHPELAEIILEESGYVAFWQREKSADAEGRLENLKELVQSITEFETLAGFLDHVSLVMEASQAEGEARVSIMTLHAAKGLEFETVFLPGWEEGVFPHARALEEQGRAGLVEERRLAYVGLTRAKRRALISFAKNRRIHGLWQAVLPSRFIEELPPAHVAIEEAGMMPQAYGAYAGESRFDRMGPFGASQYTTPGW